MTLNGSQRITIGSGAAMASVFADLHRKGEALGAPDYFNRFSKIMAEGVWAQYDRLLSLFPGGVSNKDVIDFGCKFGHVIPMLLAKGARSAIGLDVNADYIEVANRVIGTSFPGARFHQSTEGFIPLPPESCDCLFVNEVISHMNPGYLETFYSEASRVLRRGGYLLISDGNNLAHEGCRKALPALYEAWENGPSGRKTDRDVVTESYLEMRRRLIQDQCPALEKDELDYLAANTSGLFGARLSAAVQDYVEERGFVERPYRYGTCPTNPCASDVVMERGFYPQQVEMALEAYGIEAHQIFPDGTSLENHGWKATLRRGLLALAGRWPPSLEQRRGELAAFQILGLKRR